MEDRKIPRGIGRRLMIPRGCGSFAFISYGGCILDSRERKKLFLGLDLMREEAAVLEDREVGHWRRHVLRRLVAVDMDDPQRDAVRLCRLGEPRHPIVGIGALVGIIEHEPVLRDPRMLCAVLEARGSSLSRKDRYQSCIPQSASSATRKPLCLRYLGSARNPS